MELAQSLRSEINSNQRGLARGDEHASFFGAKARAFDTDDVAT
jgi:hypothetical protein